MTLLGNGVFAGVTSEGSRNGIILDFGWALKPMTDVFIRERRGEFGHRFQISSKVRDTKTYKVECRMKTEAEE